MSSFNTQNIPEKEGLLSFPFYKEGDGGRNSMPKATQLVVALVGGGEWGQEEVGVSNSVLK